MNYKKKVFVLSAAALLLVIACVIGFIFDRGRAEERKDAYTWIGREALESANRIELTGMAGPVILERKNNVWVMPLSSGAISGDYPVKQSRVEDFFNALSRRASYPLRSVSGGAERLGLTEDRASRVRVLGGSGPPLLDMLIGFGAAPGSAVYLRRAGREEARSGDDVFSVFTETGRNPWFDLALFQNTQNIIPENIQRIHILPPDENGRFTLSRNGRDWVFSSPAAGGVSARTAPRYKVESYLRSLINSEAEDFFYRLEKDDPVFGAAGSAGITLETGDGGLITLRAAAGDEPNGSRPVIISYDNPNAVYSGGPDLVFSLAEWTFENLFPGGAYFTAPPGGGE